ncbi:MAG TPA: YggS family pyridoxal phosphate-dependent enzyme [Steroidobacteraceae bacterium]|jgi:pyridoxal phosphate enzyme (YggS family)|nr:YggS family pyridoxal phosphate-dependent enzyme [Steroidobacteraceae bacterium]
MLIDPQNLTLHVNHVRSRIRSAAMAAGRDPAAVTLVAVTKAKTAESVRLAATAGVTDFGENYLQEALAKMDQLGDVPLQWHFIGGIQSNKTRPIAERFDWVHGVDRLNVAKRLSEQRPFHAPPLNVCLQVALDPEPTKGGAPPEALASLAAEVAGLPRLRLRGLMCVPPPQREPEAQRPVFARLRVALQELNARGLKLDTLSMGMSADFECAIAEGATLVRIGTALFGSR